MRKALWDDLSKFAGQDVKLLKSTEDKEENDEARKLDTC